MDGTIGVTQVGSKHCTQQHNPTNSRHRTQFSLEETSPITCISKANMGSTGTTRTLELTLTTASAARSRFTLPYDDRNHTNTSQMMSQSSLLCEVRSVKPCHCFCQIGIIVFRTMYTTTTSAQACIRTMSTASSPMEKGGCNVFRSLNPACQWAQAA